MAQLEEAEINWTDAEGSSNSNVPLRDIVKQRISLTLFDLLLVSDVWKVREETTLSL